MTENRKPNWRGNLTINRGHWWALVDVSEELQTWAPIGSVAKMSVCEAMGCYKLATWYWSAGILDKITGPIIQNDKKRIVNVIRGTYDGGSLPQAEPA